MKERLILIAKYTFIVDVLFRVYGFVAYFLITLLEKSELFQSAEPRVLLPRLAIFPIWLITSPFIYYFVYKVVKKYVLKNPALRPEVVKISFGVWVLILHNIFNPIFYLLNGVILNMNTIDGFYLYPFVVVLVASEIASRDKPSTRANVIGIGFLLFMFFGIFVAGLISGYS